MLTLSRRAFATLTTMAWRSHGVDNPDLVRALEANKIIRARRVRDAMLAVDRGRYVPNAGRAGVHAEAYYDHPLPIGYNATISAPHMHAACLELLAEGDRCRVGARALDVGSGTGYLCACLGELVLSESFKRDPENASVRGEGVVVGVEHVPELVVRSMENIERDGKGAWTRRGRLKLVCGDGRKGYSEHAPYDVIHVGASAAFVPEALLDQLAIGGRMVIPVGDSRGQELLVIDRLADGTYAKRAQMGVIYVPLTSKESQLAG